jgi:acetyltransferase
LYRAGFSKIFGIGNAIDLSFNDYLSFLKDDSDTEVIVCYIESFSEGERFIKLCREITRDKPIVAIKVGDTEAGARAAKSHTAALTTDYRISKSILKQAGIIRVSGADQLIDIASTLTQLPKPKGRRIAVLSEGGGDNAIAADVLSRRELELPVFSESLQKKLEPLLLPSMSAANPIDYGGVAEENPEVIAKCVEICMASDEVDAVLITGFFGGFKEIIAEEIEEKEIQTAQRLLELVEEYQKPFIVHSSYAGSGITSLTKLQQNGVPTFKSIRYAANVLRGLTLHQEISARIKSSQLISCNLENNVSADFLKKTQAQNRKHLLETEARGFLAQFDLPLIEASFATNEQELLSSSSEFGFPLALKIVSPKIIHKTEVGGVKLGVKNEDELLRSYREIMAGAKKVCKKNDILGVLVSPMAKSGHECIVGFTRNNPFGPIIMYGTGGTMVELFRDISLRGLPLSDKDIDDMIVEVKGSKVLAGFRGSNQLDISSLIELIEKVAFITSNFEEISELDLNPVIVHEHGATILDSRILL